MGKTYKLGIVGYGGMASWHHENLARVEEVQPYAAYDIRPERNQIAESKGLKAYESLDAILADPDIDIILLACPNNFHADYAIRAMEAGKDVVCEKPVTMNSDEMRRVIEVKNKTGRHFSAHQNRRWDRDFLTVRKAIQNGDLGRPFFIQSKVLGSRGIPEGWRTHPQAGGGMMLDWGVHLLDQISWMMPENIRDVDCHMYHTYHEDVDDGFQARFTFDSGLLVTVEVDTNAFVSEPRWIVRGLTGSLVLRNWDCEGEIVRAKDLEVTWEDEILYTSAGPTKTMAPRTRFSQEVLPVDVIESDPINFYRNFVAVIEGRDEPVVPVEQSLYIMTLMEACFISDRERRTVHMEEFSMENYPRQKHLPKTYVPELAGVLEC